MKKNVIIGILSIVSVLSMVFAYYQQSVAQYYEAIAIEQKAIAERQSAKAMEALKQEQAAKMELDKLKNKK